MRPVSTGELLGTWERGLAEAPPRRALALLAVACPEEPLEARTGLSLGERDARLLDLREATFGPLMEALATCPACGADLEVDLQAADLRARTVGGQGRELTLEADGFTVRFRPPDTGDLIAVMDLEDALASRQALLERCLLDVGGESGRSSTHDLLAEMAAAIARRMAEADPMADARLEVVCPACGHEWLEELDIASFLWSELDAWARRLLHDVHCLAEAYGWSEPEVLALSPLRRNLYLEMVQA